MDHTPSDKVQVRSRGELQLPGTCALCGSGNNDEGYVDFSLWIEFHGTVYLCMTCWDQAAQATGYQDPEIVAHVQETNEGLAADLAQVTAELEKTNELLANWTSVISSALGSAPADLSLSLNSGGSTTEDDAVGDEVTEGSAGQAGEGESKPAEPVKGKRPPKPAQSATSDSAGEFTL